MTYWGKRRDDAERCYAKAFRLTWRRPLAFLEPKRTASTPGAGSRPAAPGVPGHDTRARCQRPGCVTRSSGAGPLRCPDFQVCSVLRRRVARRLPGEITCLHLQVNLLFDCAQALPNIRKANRTPARCYHKIPPRTTTQQSHNTATATPACTIHRSCGPLTWRLSLGI